MHWKPGWDALETRMECIGNQEGMHWKPGWNALETRMECIGNQEGMHWKPGWNAMETRKECIGNQDEMHWKPSETRMECIPNRGGNALKPGSRWFLNRGMRYFRIKTTPIFLFGRTIRALELTDSSTKNGLKTKRNCSGNPWMDSLLEILFTFHGKTQYGYRIIPRSKAIQYPVRKNYLSQGGKK